MGTSPALGRAPGAALMTFLTIGAAPGLGPPQDTAIVFSDISAEAGLVFHHFTGATGEYFMPEIMGAGAALLDFDGDGDLDIYLIQGTVLAPGKGIDRALFPPPAGWKPGNRLFRNEVVPSGSLRFTDVTERAGVGHEGYGMGAAVGDYDNDGYPDLYVTNFGSNVLYHNNGDDTFTDVTLAAQVDDVRWSTSAAFLDFDSDGDLDLFCANYVDFTVKGNKQCHAATGERDYCTPKAYAPAPARLFRNEGDGRFLDVTDAAGVGLSVGPGLGVACADYNDDGWVDIYVANDGAANHLWLNQGDGVFAESGAWSDVAYGGNGQAQAGMGVALDDFDGDGDEDLLITNLTEEGAVLYHNEGRGIFLDATVQAGLLQATFASTGFGAVWCDDDNDGIPDLFLANGGVAIVESERGNRYPYAQRNQVLLNAGGGRLRDVTQAAGPAFKLSEVSRGAACGDIDNDGDLDLLVTNNNGPVRLLRNDAGSRRHWLEVRLVGVKSNRQAIGARAAVLRTGRRPLWKRVHSDSSYLTAGDTRVHFGLGDRPDLEAVWVRWPDGSTEVFTGVAGDSAVTLRQGSGRPGPPAPEPVGGPSPRVPR